jgi:putative ABC transport system substrate-binding protein
MPYIKGLPTKQIELAREIRPRALKIGIVNNSSDVKAVGQWDEIEAAAPKLDVKIASADVRKPEEIEPAFKKFEAEHVEVVVVLQSNLLILERARIATVASATRLPTVYGYREHVETGGLISYGVNLDSCFRRSLQDTQGHPRRRSPGRVSDQIGARHQHQDRQGDASALSQTHARSAPAIRLI